MQVDDVYVDEHTESDTRSWFEFQLDEHTHHGLTLDEDENNFRVWRGDGYGWKKVGWLLDSDSNRRSFDENGTDTREIVSDFVRKKVEEYAERKARLQPLVEVVRAFAVAHYDDGGWDRVVETCEDEYLIHHLDKAFAASEEQAVNAFKPMVEVWADRDAEYRAMRANWDKEARDSL